MQDCTEREIKAVDSEHKKNIQSDMWRFFQMEKHIWNENHAYHKFGTGNYESLWSKPKSEGRDPRQQLIDWWKKYYCARRMKLVVVGKEDLDTLEGWVKDRFEKVPIRTANVTQEVGIEGVRIAWPENPVGAEQMGVITFTRPVQDSRGLEITFPFPDLDHLYQSKPGHYVTHFIGHEGRGSILSYLKKKGWVNYLRAGQSHGAAGFDFMKITVDLTPTGLENWQEVTTTIFKYISLLRSSPPSSEVFNEIKAIAEISFKFAEKTKNGRYATALSNWMQRPLPREKIVSGGGLLEDFRPDEVAAVLQLLDPRRATVGITTRELPKDVDGSFDRNEPIYGTEYTQRPIPERILKEVSQVSGVEGWN
jgi:insulysin